LSDLPAVSSLFEQPADRALTGDNVKLVVQESDHVILIGDGSLTEEAKELLSMILTQSPRSTNRTKHRRDIAEMKVFFTHTIDLLPGNMSGFVYERCAIATGEVKLNLVSKVLGKSFGYAR